MPIAKMKTNELFVTKGTMHGALTGVVNSILAMISADLKCAEVTVDTLFLLTGISHTKLVGIISGAIIKSSESFGPSLPPTLGGAMAILHFNGPDQEWHKFLMLRSAFISILLATHHPAKHNGHAINLAWLESSSLGDGVWLGAHRKSMLVTLDICMGKNWPQLKHHRFYNWLERSWTDLMSGDMAFLDLVGALSGEWLERHPFGPPELGGTYPAPSYTGLATSREDWEKKTKQFYSGASDQPRQVPANGIDIIAVYQHLFTQFSYLGSGPARVAWVANSEVTLHQYGLITNLKTPD